MEVIGRLVSYVNTLRFSTEHATSSDILHNKSPHNLPIYIFKDLILKPDSSPVGVLIDVTSETFAV